MRAMERGQGRRARERGQGMIARERGQGMIASRASGQGMKALNLKGHIGGVASSSPNK